MSDRIRRVSNRLLGIPGAPIQEIESRKKRSDCKVVARDLASGPGRAEGTIAESQEEDPSETPAAANPGKLQPCGYLGAIAKDRARDSGFGAEGRESVGQHLERVEETFEEELAPRKESAASLQWDDEELE